MHLDKMKCCDTAPEVKHTTNLAMPKTNLQTHHLKFLTLQNSQNEISTKQGINKSNTAFVFHTECIQGVVNVKIHVDI